MKKTAGFSSAHIQLILQKIPFFRDFTPSEKERMASQQDSFAIAQPQEMIVKKGSMDRVFYIIMSGVVEVLAEDDKSLLFELHPGQVFGEITFLTEIPRTSSVRAQDVCILMKIDQQLMARMRADIREKIKDQLIAKLVQRILSQR
ncbi:MAG: cyclic nucleotide-binding domain-containing protein [Oleispira sp.]|nr:cyclic nucleotide-binding domain-containing protein [Oleispira sp.]